MIVYLLLLPLYSKQHTNILQSKSNLSFLYQENICLKFLGFLYSYRCHVCKVVEVVTIFSAAELNNQEIGPLLVVYVESVVGYLVVFKY